MPPTPCRWPRKDPAAGCWAVHQSAVSSAHICTQSRRAPKGLGLGLQFHSPEVGVLFKGAGRWAVSAAPLYHLESQELL